MEEKRYKYTVYAQRPSDKSWSVWTRTNDFKTAMNAVKTIEGYGWKADVNDLEMEVGVENGKNDKR